MNMKDLFNGEKVVQNINPDPVFLLNTILSKDTVWLSNGIENKKYYLKRFGEALYEPLLLCAVWRIFCFGKFINFSKKGVRCSISCGY